MLFCLLLILEPIGVTHGDSDGLGGTEEILFSDRMVNKRANNYGEMETMLNYWKYMKDKQERLSND